MQQWHKPDVPHRFYTYHTISTALQLEDLPLKTIIIDEKTQKSREVKDYRRIEPVITLVWMVDDIFGNEKDILSYIMTPEDIVNFINDDLNLWSKETIDELFKEREKLLALMKNKQKHIDFIPKNRLIFVFQKNIVKNPRHQRYFNWFKFAELTKNKNNTENDFKELEQSQSFKKPFITLKKRIGTDELTDDEKQYITDEDENRAQIQRYIDGVREDQLSVIVGELENIGRELEDKDKELKKNERDHKKELEDKDKELETLKKQIAQLKEAEKLKRN